MMQVYCISTTVSECHHLINCNIPDEGQSPETKTRPVETALISYHLDHTAPPKDYDLLGVDLSTSFVFTLTPCCFRQFSE